MHYTYLHRRESDNAPFYIGKGKGKRAWAHASRNQHWKNTVAKHGLKVEIVAEWDDEEMAFEHEKFLIACFRDMGHQLVNITDGGEGVSGFVGFWSGKKQSDEHKAKNSSALTGKKKSPEHIKNAANAKIGKFFGPLSFNHKHKISQAKTGIKHSKEHIEKRAASRRGKTKENNIGVARAAEKLRGKPSGSKDKFWANNGFSSKMFPKDLPLPEGFVLGRLKKEKA
jgi:hypothetical protein